MSSDVAQALNRVADALERLVLASEKSVSGQQEQSSASAVQEREKAVLGPGEKEEKGDTSFNKWAGEQISNWQSIASSAKSDVLGVMNTGMSTVQGQLGVTNPVNRAMGEMAQYAQYGQALTPQEIEFIASRVASEQTAAKINVNSLYPMVNAGTQQNIFNRFGEAYTQYDEDMQRGQGMGTALKSAWNTFMGNNGDPADYVKQSLQRNAGLDAFGR